MDANEIVFDGGTASFEALYERCYPQVEARCRRLLGDAEQARDVVQEAFLRAFERIDRFGGDRRFAAWVWTIARNICVDHHRRRDRRAVPLDVDPESTCDPAHEAHRRYLNVLARDALARLEPRQRTAVLLHDLGGLSCARVAERLGISECAAQSLLARARRRLRRELVAKAAPSDLF